MGNNTKNFISGIQVLRFFAALIVVLLHYFYVGPTSGKYGVSSPIFSNVFFHGYLGVTIFFCISGFIICEVSTALSAWQFAVKRATRILPGFIICVVISSLFLWYFSEAEILEPFKILSNFSLVPQIFGYEYVDGVYWSLLYEVIFYGWVFIFIALGIFYRDLKMICMIWCGISLVNLLLLDSIILERLFLTTHSGAFMIGICIWIYIQEKTFKIFSISLLLLSLLITALGLQRFGVFVLPDGSTTPTPNFIFALLMAVGIGLFVYLSIFIKIAPKYRALTLLLGGVSYPLYLLHQEIGYAIFSNFHSTASILSIGSVIIVVFLFSILVYFVEKKLIISLRDLFLIKSMRY